MKNPTRAQQLTAAINHYWALRDGKKPRRKKAWHEHKGVAFYDAERMRQPLLPVIRPNGIDPPDSLPSWIDPNWEPTENVESDRAERSSVEHIDEPDHFEQAADYVFEPCYVQSVVRVNGGYDNWHNRAVSYLYEIRFRAAVQSLPILNRG